MPNTETVIHFSMIDVEHVKKLASALGATDVTVTTDERLAKFTFKLGADLHGNSFEIPADSMDNAQAQAHLCILLYDTLMAMVVAGVIGPR